MNLIGTVYLLHFKEPHKHAKHYMGFAEEGHLESRLATHRKGSGARLTRAVAQSGNDFVLARTWEGKDRNFERSLKNRKNSPRLCPICNGPSKPSVN